MSHFLSVDVSPEVIRAACAGDARAHEAIYRTCQRPVYTLIRRLVPRSAVADDVLQDTFVEILRSIATYSGEGSFGGWVRSIAVNKCLMYLRSPWHRSLAWLDDESQQGPELVAPGVGPEAMTEARTDLARALGALPPVTRAVVWLYDVEGYTHPEIAEMLDKTVSFSKSQLARAHAKLRVALEPDTTLVAFRRQPPASQESLAAQDPPSMSRFASIPE